MCDQKIRVDLDLVVCARKVPDGLFASLRGFALNQKDGFVRLWDPFDDFEPLEILLPPSNFLRVSPNETVHIFLLEDRLLCQTCHDLGKNHTLTQTHFNMLALSKVTACSHTRKTQPAYICVE